MFNERELEIINSESDYAKGIGRLAYSYRMGKNGFEANLKKAHMLTCMSVWEGNDKLGAVAGYDYFKGIGVEVDFTYSFLYYLHAAKNGDAAAQYRVGLFYSDVENHPNNCICPINLYTGHVWYESAAEQGNVQAMYCLATNYHYGRGTIFDLDKALYWYEKAARNGNVNAMHNTAAFYHGAEGIAYTDENLAGYWFNEAAKKGLEQSKKILSQYKYSSFSGKWKKID